MRPNGDSNQQLFSLRDDAQLTEPHQSRVQRISLEGQLDTTDSGTKCLERQRLYRFWYLLILVPQACAVQSFKTQLTFFEKEPDTERLFDQEQQHINSSATLVVKY